MPKPWRLLLTCEHGGYKVPRPYLQMMSEADKSLLPTHRGWDGGALQLAKRVSKTLDAPLLFTDVSRLLIDCNRSLHHKTVFGPAFREMGETIQQRVIQDFYLPYRESVVEAIQKLIAREERVLHLAFHSFTPELNGEVRNAELGLLYDPGRKSEAQWADRMMAQLKAQDFPWRVRRNYPYLGKSDGFTRFLRKTFPVTKYAGFELEFNQSLLIGQSFCSNFEIDIENFLSSPLFNFSTS